MSESTRSEKSLARFSPPVPELDDHRSQMDSDAQTDAAACLLTGQQHNMARSDRASETIDRPDLLHVQDALRETRPVSRDFEHAIVDDDRSVRDIDCFARRLSTDPSHRRRRRSRNQQDMTPRSRESSVSSRSSSPPNSVEAFADPRRRERANTMESHVPPDMDNILQRTVSGGSRGRRPTFSNASAVRQEQGEVRLEIPESVCAGSYEEPARIPVIDYEELEEFVALNRKTKPVTSRKQSMSSQSRGQRVFHDLRPWIKASSDLPYIVMEKSSPEHSSSESECLKHDLEKIDRVTDKAMDGKVFLEKLQNENEPTRFSFFSSECQSTIHAAELGDLVLPGDSFRDLFQLGPDGGVWWLDVVNPTEAEVGALSRAFSIHPLTAEDIMTQEAREKVELFKQYYFVCFRTFYQVDKSSDRFLEPVNLYMVVYRDGVLSFSFTDHPHAANVRKRIGKLRDYVSLSSDWICYAMM
jgi:magnesium transporter